MRENLKMKHYALPEVKNLKVHGRTTGELSPLTLFWTGSAVELNVTGAELWIEVESDYEGYEPWINIMVNSVSVSRMMITSGRRWLCVFRGMNEGVVKNIRIVRELQAMSDDPGNYLQVHALKSDGEFLPVEEKPYKIEFVGDSITSGEGAIGATIEEDWIPMWFGAVENYTYMAAEALNADYRIISQSGWGVLNSWDNNPHHNIPDYYGKVCGILRGEHNTELGAQNEYDFTSWQPDVVVVNLGTNDGASFSNPEWRDQATGESHKQRRNEDGSFHEEDLKAFEAKAEDFLYQLRSYNPKAHLIWAYGMVDDTMKPAIMNAFDAYCKKSGDRKVSYLQLPAVTDETVGARWHPGRLAHMAAAKVLSEYINELRK